ncbi:hypothetical protein GJAV_G00229090 [Gymnothorax javanicus]|nr:hypothetical protein GJAV_G00229090 [Gymnothorax javanicus]
MSFSWKVVILLTSASIVIQYLVIRTFIAQPCNSPTNQICNVGNYSTYNGPRRTNILILASTRTGSSFMGQLLNQHSDVIYLFEPLYHVQSSLLPRLNRSNYDTALKLMAGASRDLLRSLYDCDFYFLERYITPPPVKHITNNLFRRGASRALCSPPVCRASGPRKANWEVKNCENKCPLDMTLAATSCRQLPSMAIKIVRIPELGDLRTLVEDPRLNLKIIHLVRDPRAILSSRMETFWSLDRRNTMEDMARKNQIKLDPTGIRELCEDYHNSISMALSRPHWLKGKYMLVRYEDLARNPLQKTKEIYEFLGMSLDKNVINWIQYNTREGNGPASQNFYSTTRDSKATAESWRLKLSFEMATYSQNICSQVLHQLGYKAVKSSEELKNLSLTLIQNKTFEPFL